MILDKVHAVPQRILNLCERAIDDDVHYLAIEAEIKKLNKEVNNAEAIAVATEIGILRRPKTKKDAVEKIHHKIVERKESYKCTQS